MKNIILTIALALLGFTANAQIVDNSYFDEKSYIYVDSHSLRIGNYLFEGTCFHGYYTLSYITDNDTIEAEALADFISKNKNSIQDRYGVKIHRVYVADVVSFNYDNPPYRRTSHGTAVTLEIVTDEYNEYMKGLDRERDERLASLNDIL